MIRAFSFLQREGRSGILYFRLPVPLQGSIGKIMTKRALSTNDKWLAIPVASVYMLALRDISVVMEDCPIFIK